MTIETNGCITIVNIGVLGTIYEWMLWPARMIVNITSKKLTVLFFEKGLVVSSREKKKKKKKEA